MTHMSEGEFFPLSQIGRKLRPLPFVGAPAGYNANRFDSNTINGNSIFASFATNVSAECQVKVTKKKKIMLVPLAAYEVIARCVDIAVRRGY